MNNRIFGVGMLILCGLLMLLLAQGTLGSAPVLMALVALGALGGLALGAWALLGKL